MEIRKYEHLWDTQDLLKSFEEYVEEKEVPFFQVYRFLNSILPNQIINSSVLEAYFSEKSISRYISKKIRYIVLKRQKWNCNQCGCKLKYSEESVWDGKVAHIDHIYPFSKKESYKNGEENINEPSNLQALCPECNLSKGKKEIQ